MSNSAHHLCLFDEEILRAIARVENTALYLKYAETRYYS